MIYTERFHAHGKQEKHKASVWNRICSYNLGAFMGKRLEIQIIFVLLVLKNIPTLTIYYSPC